MDSKDGEIIKELRHYCVVREGLSAEKKMVMFGHAAGESAVLGIPPGKDTVFIALQANEVQLKDLCVELTSHGFEYVEIIEPYEPYIGQLLAVGIEPSPRSVLRKLLFHFEKATV